MSTIEKDAFSRKDIQLDTEKEILSHNNVTLVLNVDHVNHLKRKYLFK